MESADHDPVRILFVCMGNICRSPAAEGMLRAVLDRKGFAHLAEIDSAGTIGLHTGNPPDERMTEAARKRGIEVTGSARQVSAEDLEAFDWILAMDEENLEDLQFLAMGNGDGAPADIALFCRFCNDPDRFEVPDPYYGGPEGFEMVLDLLEDGCGEIARLLRDGSM